MKYLFLILFFSFFISAIAQGKTPTLKSIVDNYISDYERAKLENPLVAIFITSDQSLNYTISDIAEGTILGGINRLRIQKQNFVIGVYKGILCKISFNPTSRFLKPINVQLIEKARKASKLRDENGVEHQLELDLINYEPSLIITYDLTSNMKNKIYSDGKTENCKF